MIAYCLFLLFVLLFMFVVDLFLCMSLLCPSLATMSSDGYFLVRCLLSAFPAFPFFFFFSKIVPVLIWLGSVYLVLKHLGLLSIPQTGWEYYRLSGQNLFMAFNRIPRWYNSNKGSIL